MVVSEMTWQTVISGVVTAVLIGIANYLQYRAQRGKAESDKNEVKTVAAEAKTAAAATKEKIDSVYRAVNGNGLMGEMKSLKGRFDQVERRLDGIERIVRGEEPRPPSDGGLDRDSHGPRRRPGF